MGVHGPWTKPPHKPINNTCFAKRSPSGSVHGPSKRPRINPSKMTVWRYIRQAAAAGVHGPWTKPQHKPFQNVRFAKHSSRGGVHGPWTKHKDSFRRDYRHNYRHNGIRAESCCAGNRACAFAGKSHCAGEWAWRAPLCQNSCLWFGWRITHCGLILGPLF